MIASHQSSRDLYEVSIRELDTLAESAWSVAGCHGARLSGAGFGGCVTALVDRDAVGRLIETMTRAFRDGFDREPETLVCRIAGGAGLVAMDGPAANGQPC